MQAEEAPLPPLEGLDAAAAATPDAVAPSDAEVVRACEEVFGETEDRKALTVKIMMEFVAKRLGRDNVDSAKPVIRTTLYELFESNEPSSQNSETTGHGDSAAAQGNGAAVEKTPHDDEEESSSSSDEEAKSPSKGGKPRGWNKPMRLSPELAAVVGQELESRGQVVKKLWAYVKANNLQNPSNRTEWLLDDALQRVFKKKKISGFAMNKFLGAHMSDPSEDPRASERSRKDQEDGAEQDDDDEEEEEEAEPRPKRVKAAATAAAAKKSPSPKKAPTPRTTKKAKESDGDDDEGGKAKPSKAKSGWASVEYLLSPELQAVFGTTHMSRPQVVKRLWDYVKSNNLQNPSNKNEWLLDDKLKAVFAGHERITGFAMNKFIGGHLLNSDGTPAAKKVPVDAEGAAAPSQPHKAKTGGGGFSKQFLLSPALADVCGCEKASRPEIVKKLWAYVREKDLQNPRDKREWILDDKLSKVFMNRKKVNCFKMNTMIGNHLSAPGELGGGGNNGEDDDEDEEEEEEEEGAGEPDKKRSKGEEEPVDMYASD